MKRCSSCRILKAGPEFLRANLYCAPCTVAWAKERSADRPVSLSVSSPKLPPVVMAGGPFAEDDAA